MPTDKIVEKIKTNRRGLLKGLIKAGFVAPVVTSFTMDSLTAQNRTVLSPNTAPVLYSNTTPIKVGCMITSPVLKQTLPNVGYSGPLFFHGHAQELGLVQTFSAAAGLPMPVTSLCPAAPSRATLATTLQVMTNGPSAAALRFQHFPIPGMTLLTSSLTVNGQIICNLLSNQGQVLPSGLQVYPDLNSLFEDMAHGNATIETSILYQGYQVNLFGRIRTAANQMNIITLTS